MLYRLLQHIRNHEMTLELLQLFATLIFISLSTYGGGSQAFFYQYGVLQTHLITATDLSVALAFGYATPGPAVFGIATFIGYRLAGLGGAIVGTIGIFIVPFATALVSARYLSNVLNSRRAKTIIQAIGLGAAGLVAATSFNVLQYATATWWQWAVSLAAFYLSLRWKINPLFLIMAGTIIGLAV